jgi:hypothetical protein
MSLAISKRDSRSEDRNASCTTARRTSTTGTFSFRATAWAISYSRRGAPSRIRSRIGCHMLNSRRIFLPAVFSWRDGHFRRPQSRRSAFSNTAYPKLRGWRSSARVRISCLRFRFIKRQARTGRGTWKSNPISGCTASTSYFSHPQQAAAAIAAIGARYSCDSGETAL